MAALDSTPLISAPPSVERLPVDIKPTDSITYVLGDAGFAWTRSDGSVCVLMANDSGGCLVNFTKPVLLFLTGEMSEPGGRYVGDHVVTGVVPDVVRAVTLVTTTGDRVGAPIADNAFRVELAAGSGIVGEEITLTDGTVFFNEERVTPPLLTQ